MSPEIIGRIEDAITQLGTDATQQAIADLAEVSRGSVQRYVTGHMNSVHAQPPTSQARSKSTVKTQSADYVSVFDKIPLWGYGLIILCLVAGFVYIPPLVINRAINKQEDNKEPG
jgi:hypothetical protein